MSGDESEVPGDPEEDPSLMLDSDMYITDEDDSIERIKRWVVGTWIDLKLWAKLRYLNTRIWIGERRQEREERAKAAAQEAEAMAAAAAHLEISESPTFDPPEATEEDTDTKPAPEVDHVIDESEVDDEPEVESLPASFGKSTFQRKFIIPRIIRVIDLFYGVLILSYAVALMDHVYNLYIFPEWAVNVPAFMSNRLISDYAGTVIPVEIRAIPIVAFLIIASLSLILGSKSRVALLFLFGGILVSILLRVHPVWFEDWTRMDYLPFLIDTVWGCIFIVTCSLPAFTRGLFDEPRTFLDESGAGESAIWDEFGDSPESFTDGGVLGLVGEDVPQGFDVERPTPPKRRRWGQGSPYEILFLGLALLLWPLTLAMAVIVIGEITVQGYTYHPDQQGLLLLLLPLIVTLGCTVACFNLDREAREGDVYAKEKAAYHRDMDQYLLLKEAYYKRHVSKISESDKSEE
jgi:hypothetical protein